ncbi:hypothetical protein RM533_01665 [Croceicoccus sp. F390]|uniref:EF-hand domain-containing protein n=1 Tax=Croceicoccus esteveae TaxID=3075597 RepID=A0ABU2ZE61_9SPHN|nr:hypothetical protein [Croceicoccus sp. F390]MDT0574887.1 hypothetical protein [Croceicoccus sp. F390]
MKTVFPALATASLLALGLSACADETPDEVVETDVVPQVTLPTDVGPRTDVVLNPDQQAALGRIDTDAVNTEYGELRAQIAREMPSAPDIAANQGASNTTSTTDANSSAGANSSGGSTSGTTATPSMPSRANMDFAYLDRNDDGKLSVAEYAIWAVGVDPNEPKPNDNTKPFLTQDQINEAGQTFFYYDKDGTTYLSQAEFQQARNRES